MAETIIKVAEDINLVFRREINQAKGELETRIQGVVNLMQQHDQLTKIANDKAQETLDERLSKMNEFREQQKDIITKFATIAALDALSLRFEDNIKTVSQRYETHVANLTEKMETLKKHQDEKIELTKKALEDKRETEYKGILEMFNNVESKTSGNLKAEIEKFMAVDKTMTVLINTNADVSNRGINANEKRISELFELKNLQEGSLTVIKYILSGVITIMIALIIAFLSKLLIK